MEDSESREILQALSASSETQDGENADVKDDKMALVQAFKVRLKSVADSSHVVNRRKDPYKKVKRYLFCYCASFWFLIFSVTVLLGILNRPNFWKQSVDKRPECTDYHSTTHTQEIIKVLTTTKQDEGQSQNPGDAKKKAKMFFQSCLAVCKQDLKAPKILFRLTPDVFQISEKPNSTSMFVNNMLDKLANFSSIQGKLEYLHNELGFSPIFHWAVGPGLKNSSVNVLQIMPNHYKEKDSTNPTILSQELSKALFSNRGDDDDKESQLNSLMEMDKIGLTRMADLSNAENVLSLLKPMTLAKLQKRFDLINWQHFFNDALTRRGHDEKGQEVGVNEKILVWNLPKLQALYEAIKKVKMVLPQKTFNSLLDKFLVLQMLRFALKPLWATDDCHLSCKKETVRHFEYAVAALLLEKSPTFSQPGGWTPVFSAVREIAENIRAEFIQMLEQSQWHEGIEDNPSDSGQIARALVEKAKATKIRIGYPEFIDDPQQLNEYHASIEYLSESNYFENLQQILIAKRVRNLKQFRKPVDKSRWRTGPENGGITVVTANAVTLLQFNEIVLPLGVLFRPIFHLNSSLAQNYGALGMFIGHELFHLQDGNFQNRTARVRQKLSDCLVRQYSNFQYDNGSPFDGTWTLDENFADNGGLRIAMRAFLHHLERQRKTFTVNNQFQNSQDLHLQKLEELQTFFRSFAETWCGGDHARNTNIRSHSPGKFRVLGTLQNTPGFAEAFSCPKPQVAQMECPVMKTL